MKKKVIRSKPSSLKGYSSVVSDISQVIELARSSVSRSVNSIMTAVYWLIGWRIVEFEQGGKTRAEYGEEILKNLSDDLTKRFGRGYSRQNLQQMRQFYLRFSNNKIRQTVSGKLKQTHAKEKLPIISGVVTGKLSFCEPVEKLPEKHKLEDPEHENSLNTDDDVTEEMESVIEEVEA